MPTSGLLGLLHLEVKIPFSYLKFRSAPDPAACSLYVKPPLLIAEAQTQN